MHILKALAGMDKGRLAEDLDEAVKRVLQGCRETGKTGAVTLKIRVKKSDDDSVLLEGDIKETVPVPNRNSNLFFIDRADGALSRQNPDQPSLFEDKEGANPTAARAGEEKEERSA